MLPENNSEFKGNDISEFGGVGGGGGGREFFGFQNMREKGILYTKKGKIVFGLVGGS